MHSQIENRKAGIFWMLATMFWFLVLDAIVKFALQTYPLIEVTWGRFFFATLIAAAWAGRKLPQVIFTKQLNVQILRATFLAATTTLFNLGLLYVPLNTASTIMFMTPVLVTLLSGLILGEVVGWRRWTSIGVGFLGAIISMGILQTGLTNLNTGAIALLCAALTNACYQIITRKLRGEDQLTTLLYSTAVGAVLTSLIVPFIWVWPDFIGWVLLVATGLAGCIGHWCLIRAFSNAPATVVAPFAYSSLIWSALFGFIFWSEVPKLATLCGAALIMCAGLYIFFHEKNASPT